MNSSQKVSNCALSRAVARIESFWTDSERVSFAFGWRTWGGRRWRQSENEGWVENVVSALTRTFVVSSVFACSGLNWYLQHQLGCEIRNANMEVIQLELINIRSRKSRFKISSRRSRGMGNVQFEDCQVSKTVEGSVRAL